MSPKSQSDAVSIDCSLEAPLEHLPIFLREGAIIPWRQPLQFVGEKPLQRLRLDVFPAASHSSYCFYEDDGNSFAYEQGSYRCTDRYRYHYRKDSTHGTLF